MLLLFDDRIRFNKNCRFLVAAASPSAAVGRWIKWGRPLRFLDLTR